MKKVLLITLAVLVFLALAAGIGGYALFGDALRVIGTIENIGGAQALYTMVYAGDYGFDAFLEAGGASNSDEVARYISGYISRGFYTYEVESAQSGCSTIAAATPEGAPVFGRNFDWTDCTAMVVTTAPPDGYRSVSTVNLDFLGYDENYQPDGVANSFLALGAPYVPLDGMNEKGLCVADLVIEDAGVIAQDSGKPNLTTTTAIRLLLDKAATVEEALALLGEYDMHSDIGTMHHLAIADSAGHAVVVEYVDNVMRVTEAPVVTNFFLAPGAMHGRGSAASKERFAILSEIYTQNSGEMDENDVKTALEAVAQQGRYEPEWKTQWSIVYNQKTLELHFFHREDFEMEYQFNAL